MTRLTTLAATAIGALLVGGPEAPAAPPGGGGGSPGGSPGRSRGVASSVPQRDQTPGMHVGGTVVSRSGGPLGSVIVKMFANGMIVASTTTDPEGSFEIEGNPSISANDTTVLWFESPGSERVPASVILSLSEAAQEQHLYPDCTPRITFLGNAARVEVKMLTVDERNAAVRESGCLEGGGTAP